MVAKVRNNFELNIYYSIIRKVAYQIMKVIFSDAEINNIYFLFEKEKV